MKLWEHGPNDAWYYRQAITGDVISSAVWTIHPMGPTLDSQTDTESSTQIRVSQLVRGIQYALKVHLMTGSGQAFDRIERILCTE